MQILSRLPGHCHRAGLGRVMILPVAAARADEKPAVGCNLPEYFPDFHARKSIQTFRAEQMADSHAVVELLPGNRVTAGFERPVGALYWRGLGEPLQPRKFFVRHAQLATIGQFKAQPFTRETHVARLHRRRFLSSKVLIPVLQQARSVFFRQLQDMIQLRAVVAMIVFHRNGLQPNLRHHADVNDVARRRLARIRRAKPGPRAFHLERRPDSGRSRDGFFSAAKMLLKIHLPSSLPGGGSPARAGGDIRRHETAHPVWVDSSARQGVSSVRTAHCSALRPGLNQQTEPRPSGGLICALARGMVGVGMRDEVRGR